MAYEFKPYRSVYRDPGSVKVAETLRQRYVENFASDSLLDKSLNEMLVEAEFAGDVERANELKQRLRNSAAGRAERGDFENLGMQINMDVRDFSRNYEPIKKNYEVREQDKAAKQKLVEAGRITNEQYNQWEKRSLMNYNEETGDLEAYRGLSYDEQGNVVAGSAYNPTTIAQNVNVDKEILNALQSIEAEQEGGYVTKVPEMRRLVDTNGDGKIDQNDEAYEYMVTRTDGTTRFIDPSRVRAVTQEVLNRGDVKAYMEQDADFYTFDMREDELDSLLNARRTSIEAKLASGRLSESETAEATRGLAQINAALEGSVGAKREMARAAKLDAESERLMDMAIDTKAVSSTTGGGFQVDYSARQKELWRQVRENNDQRNPPRVNPSSPGVPDHHVSGVRDPITGEITGQSVDNFMNTNREMAEAAASTVAEYEFFGPSGPQGVEAFTDFLDTATTEEIASKLQGIAEDNGGVINRVDAEGNVTGTVSVQQALNEITASKGVIEHYRRLERASDLMMEMANHLTDTEDGNIGTASEEMAQYDQHQNTINELRTNQENRLPDEELTPEQQSYRRINGDPTLNYAGFLMQGIMNAFEMNNGLSTAVGNIPEYVHSMMGDLLSMEEIQAEYDDILANEGLVPISDREEMSERALQRFNAKAGQGRGLKTGEVIRELERRVEKRRQWMNDATEGNTTYPVFDSPTFSTEDDWNKVVELIKGQSANTMIGRQSAVQNAEGDYLSIGTAIRQDGINPNTVEVQDIQVTYYTGEDGRPQTGYIVKFKGEREGAGGVSGTGTTSVVVPQNVIINSAPGVVDRIDSGTLDEEVLKTAYTVHNNFQGVTRTQKEVTVPFYDGKIDLQIKFNAIPTPGVEGGPDSFDLTQGPITITGTVNGQTVNNLDVSFAEYQKMMRDYGAQTGREADLRWAQGTAQQSN